MNKKKHIENLIKDASLDKAPKSFTDKVMQDVSVLANPIELKDEKLSSLLQNNLTESPSLNFTSSIMEAVEAKKTYKYEPIISKRVWFIITASFLSLMLYMFYNGKSEETSSVVSKLSPYLEKLSYSGLSTEVNVSSIFVFSLFTLSTLLTVDYIFKRNYV